MPKYYGTIGFTQTEKTKPGVWSEETILRRYYSGDVYRLSRRWQSSSSVNDDLSINTEVSIVSDPFALQNFHKMKFIEWMGVYWKVSNVDVQYPRLVITLGDVYNGPIGEIDGV